MGAVVWGCVAGQGRVWGRGVMTLGGVRPAREQGPRRGHAQCLPFPPIVVLVADVYRAWVTGELAMAMPAARCHVCLPASSPAPAAPQAGSCHMRESEPRGPREILYENDTLRSQLRNKTTITNKRNVKSQIQCVCAYTLPPFITLRTCGLALMRNGGANPDTDQITEKGRGR